MAVRLIDSLATTAPLALLFSDESVLKAMLEFEVALARAEARLGIIPRSAAETIAAVANASTFDPAALADATLRAGTPGIPLVKALTEQVRTVSPEGAAYVHWGATSEDVADSALVLLLKRAQPILDSDLTKVEGALERLAIQHRHTVMLGRTLLQAAPPVTFGLKAAGWLAAVRRGRAYLDASFAEALILQFGGAVGTLAALGEHGVAVAQELANELGLVCPDAPWHTHRDRLAVLVCACGVLTGTLGKMARDISLLMQNEVSEAAEPGGQGRGGSSTMPHKRNPIGCSVTLAAANRTPGLVSSFLSGMVQEHERGVGGWQAEWTTVSTLVQSTGVAVASMAEVADGLTVNADKMRANIEATGGVIFAERAMMLLGKALGRDVAHRILEEATRQCIAQGRRLTAVLAEMPDVTRHLDVAAISELDTPEQYLGSTDSLHERLLSGENQLKSGPKSGPKSEKERE
jgi:3-carboxy-cis,cis-muconate cycloisomerase